MARVKRTIAHDEPIYTATIFQVFITEKKAMGLEEQTIGSYNISYNKFMDYYGERAEYIGDIYGGMFPEWAAAMREDGLATASINTHLRTMRVFMYWCMEENHEYLTEHFKIKLLKAQETPPKDFNNDDILLLLKKPDSKAKFTEWRAWAMTNFAIGTGARVGTMAEIQIQDIKLKEATCYYRHTKSKRLQTINMPPNLVRALSEYIGMWRTVDTELDDYLFCGFNGEKAKSTALSSSFRTYAMNRGASRTSIHSLRHSYARIWFENNGDIVQLSKMLGHTTLAMSEHYMNAFANMAKDRFIECNPLETIGRKGHKKGVKRRQ